MKNILFIIALTVSFSFFGQTVAEIYKGDEKIVYDIENMGYGNFVLNQLISDGLDNKNICDKVLEGFKLIQENASSGIFFYSKKEIQKLKTFSENYQKNQRWINDKALKNAMDIEDFYFWAKKMCGKAKSDKKNIKTHEKKFTNLIELSMMKRTYDGRY